MRNANSWPPISELSMKGMSSGKAIACESISAIRCCFPALSMRLVTSANVGHCPVAMVASYF